MSNQNQQERVLPLREEEIDLILLIRHKYRFGNIEILVRDGIPIDLLKTVERIRLGEKKK